MKLSIEELEGVVANAKTSLEQYLALELIEIKGKRVPVAYTGSGSLAAIKSGREGYIWGEPGEAHPIKLYTTPQPAHAEQDGWVAIPKDMLADYRDVKNAEVENFKASYASHCYIPGSRWQRDLADLTEELTEIDKLLSAAPKPEK